MTIKSPKSVLIDTSQDASYSYNESPKKINYNLERASADKLIIEKYKPSVFHWQKEPIDTRDYQYTLSSRLSPDSVDLREYCTKIENQGALGSCTGQAIACAIECLNKRTGKPSKVKDVSRLYIYYYERLLEGTVRYDSGAYIRDGIKATSRWGAPLESYWPYVIRKFANQPSISAQKDGAKRKVTLYEKITTLEGCIDALANGYTPIVGFLVYSSFMNRAVVNSGMMPYPNVNTETLLGGHAVLLVGYDNATQRFIAKNSWGVGWGDNGYFYMPYQVIDNRDMSDDFWIIKSVNNP
jgi:C1A family cysteine protease